MAKSDLQTPVTDAAIQRSATGMIAAFGRKAPAECQAVLDHMQHLRDSSGEAVWRRILAAVEALRPRKPVHRAPPAANTEPQPPD